MFERALDFVLKHEGGYTNNYHDRGNWTGGAVGKGERKGTNMGISAASYPKLDIKNLTRDQVSAIYYRNYWLASGAAKLSPGLALTIFDIAVNMGVGRARNWLTSVKGRSNVIEQIKRLTELRCNFYAQLDHLDDLYGKGWYRRVVDCYHEALTMELFNDLRGKRLVIDNEPARYIEAASLVGDKLYIRKRR